jgi:succinyl-CoA:acetate CoA-transferase
MPMVSHADRAEYDVAIIITKHELVNFCASKERWELSIAKPTQGYRPPGIARQRGKHTPHLHDEALARHGCFVTTGRVK